MKNMTSVSEMMTSHSKIIGYYLKSFTVPLHYPGDKSDLYQEGLLGLIRAIETYDPTKSSFKTWAWFWIRSYIRDAIAKHNPTQYDHSQISFFQNNRDEAILFKQLASCLTKKEKDVYTRYLSGQTTSEIAETCGVSRQAIDQRLQRVISKLKKEYSNDRV